MVSVELAKRRISVRVSGMHNSDVGTIIVPNTFWTTFLGVNRAIIKRTGYYPLYLLPGLRQVDEQKEMSLHYSNKRIKVVLSVFSSNVPVHRA